MAAASSHADAATIERRFLLATIAVSALVWLLLASSTALLPVRWFVTLVHEAGHALAVEAVGGDVRTLTINGRGGGLTTWQAPQLSALALVVVASAGYVGAAAVGGVMLELSTRMRNGRVATAALAAAVAAVALAWVPLRFQASGQAASVSGSSSGDGRFTIAYSVAAVVVLGLLTVQPLVRVRVAAIAALSTALCLAAIDDLRQVFDISTRGGHSDAAAAAAVTPLPSWLWAALWFALGATACGLGLWAALGRRRVPEQQTATATR